MKTKISALQSCLIPFLFFFCNLQLLNAQTPAILRDWAAYSGQSDSTFKAPLISDSDYTYVASFESNQSNTGDIEIVKYKTEGEGVGEWKTLWSGSGNGRDQASGIAQDSLYIYVCGMTFSFATNNYDFLTMKIRKNDGVVIWTSTFNGSASNYDIATAIQVNALGIFVTGVSSSSTTSLDYVTIKYDTSGAEKWNIPYDYTGLMDIPFALSLSLTTDSEVIVTGGSQNTITDWDYETIYYFADSGNVKASSRASGTGAGFDRAQAAKTDASGNIYITGAVTDTTGSYDIKTIKISSSGTVKWTGNYNNDGGDDIGNDLIVDERGNTYVCGQSKQSGYDGMVIIKVDSSGNGVWKVRFDLNGYDQAAKKMCFDSWGNVVVTGTGYKDQGNSYDFLTVALDRDGNEVWRDYYDGPDHGDDHATDITSDEDGNIFVTGQAWIESNLQTVTIKYRTDYFTQPPATDTPSVAYLFYSNEGQILDYLDSATVDSVHYYTLHHSPQLFFGYGVMNMVWTTITSDTCTRDTIQRVDVSFLNSCNLTQALHPETVDSSGVYLNYFLPQCPDGITHLYGYDKLIYKDIYSGIDAIYTSNNAGLKLYFIVSPYTDAPGQNMGFQFNGQNSLSINQNWELEVRSAMGKYSFEKPRVYLLDANNNITTLPWTLSWNLPQSGQAMFSGWGNYDASKSLIIEIGRTAAISGSNCIKNLCWCTYYGGIELDRSYSTCIDPDGNIYQVGSTSSINFPNIRAGISFQDQLGRNPRSHLATLDAFIIKYDPVGNPGMNNNIKWVTYYGGFDEDVASCVGVSGDGVNNTYDPYFAGRTSSGNFLTKASAYTGTPAPHNQQFLQSDLGQGSPGMDAFIVRLDFSGFFVKWATFIGGDAMEKVL